MVRPLPGQTLATYELATAALALRWKAETVTASVLRSGRRARGEIILDVMTGEALDAPAPHPNEDT